ncbi:MAG: sensor histidine kinase [Bacteroidetes bacterium]|nr:sensor histidine kinase [Bacteroidota bacterium]
MLQSKNISPSQIAFLFASVIAGITVLLLFIFHVPWLSIVIGVVVMAGISYAVSYYIIERFVYRKIKLIYKFISQTKATKREEFYSNELLPQRSFEDVGEDVVKWAEERKSEMERLQNNETFRREFLMNLAHELKTPIFTAQGFIETLLDGAIHDPEVNTTFLQKAGKSLDRLTDLVTDLDEISKIESNQVPINKSNFVIQELIQDVYEELSQKAGNKHIKLSIKKGCEQDIVVYADRPKIKQVLVNLIENSITYGKEYGETTAGIYLVDNKEVYIEITDNGMGISDEQIARVFERFFRTDNARSRREGGSGLGLAIVKHIIEAHNHNVTCRSKIDVGSSFGFTIDKEHK